MLAASESVTARLVSYPPGFFGAFVALSLVVACGGSKAPASLSPGPQRTVQLLAPPELAELVLAANLIRATAVRIEGELRVEIEAQNRSWNYELELIGTRSGALRLRARSGQGGFELATDGNMVSVRRDGDEIVEQMRSASFLDLSASSPRRYLPLYALIDALLPQVLPEPPLGSGDLLISERHPGETRLTWLHRTPSGWRTRLRIAFDAGGMVRWRETFDDLGARVSRVSYRAWRTTPPFFPVRFELAHASGVTLQVVVGAVELNPPLEPGVFDLTVTRAVG